MDATRMAFSVELELEHETGRWIAEVPQLRGCMVYGKTREDAEKRVRALARDVLEDLNQHPEDADLIVVGV